MTDINPGVGLDEDLTVESYTKASAMQRLQTVSDILTQVFGPEFKTILALLLLLIIILIIIVVLF